MGRISFSTQLQARGPAAAVLLDDAQVATVGQGARRFPVVATVNGYTWRTSVARMPRPSGTRPGSTVSSRPWR